MVHRHSSNSGISILKKLIGLLIPIAFLCQDAFASRKSKAFEFVSNHRLYYTSYELMKELLADKEKRVNWANAQNIYAGIHPSVFIHDRELDRYANIRSPLDYPVAMRLFFTGQYDLAAQRLASIGPKHPMYTERSYLKGLISLIKGDQKRAAAYFSSCIRGYSEAVSIKGKATSYTDMFRNRCTQQLSRVLYSQGRHKDSVKVLNTVDKTEYIWPNTLLERAWSFYYLNQRPLALGTLTSFKAPVLQRYMTPEAQYLKALIYFEMCYFDRAKEISKEFNDKTWKNRGYFDPRINTDLLLRLVYSNTKPKGARASALYYYLKAFKKDIRHSYYTRAVKQVKAELKALQIIKSMPGKKALVAKINKQRQAIIADHKEFLGNLIADYQEQIQRANGHFVKLNLLLSIKERQEIRAPKKKLYSKELKELDFSEIGNVDNKFIWNFIGGFWADEIGDYAVALENRCKKD